MKDETSQGHQAFTPSKPPFFGALASFEQKFEKLKKMVLHVKASSALAAAQVNQSVGILITDFRRGSVEKRERGVSAEQLRTRPLPDEEGAGATELGFVRKFE